MLQSIDHVSALLSKPLPSNFAIFAVVTAVNSQRIAEEHWMKLLHDGQSGADIDLPINRNSEHA